MNKNEQRIWEWNILFFYLLVKNKSWIYTSNVAILDIGKERK